MEIRLKMESYVEGSCYVIPSGRKSKKTVLRFPKILDMCWLSQMLLIQLWKCFLKSKYSVFFFFFSVNWNYGFFLLHFHTQNIFSLKTFSRFTFQNNLFRVVWVSAKCIGELDTVTYVNLLLRLNISWSGPVFATFHLIK